MSLRRWLGPALRFATALLEFIPGDYPQRTSHLLGLGGVLQWTRVPPGACCSGLMRWGLPGHAGASGALCKAFGER